MAHGPLHLNWILSASLLVRSQTATKSSHYAKGCCYETRRSLGIEVSLLFTADKSSSRARCQQRLVIVQLDLVQLGPNTTNNLTSLDVPVECRSEGKSVFWIGAEAETEWDRQRLEFTDFTAVYRIIVDQQVFLRLLAVLAADPGIFLQCLSDIICQ